MNKKSILLIQPPLVFPKLANGTPTCPPIGLAYIAGSLEAAGYEVTCIDALGEAPFQISNLERNGFGTIGWTIDQIHQRIDKLPSFDAVGFSGTFSASWPLTRDLIQSLRGRYPKALFFAGGEHVSAIPEYCLNDCEALDFCIVGEGEQTSVDLLDSYFRDSTLEEVQGIVYRKNGMIVRSKKRSRNKDLNSLPQPAWHLIPLENYLKNQLGFGINLGRTMPMLATRGCPYSCTFCSNPSMWGTNWVPKSPSVVVDEILKYKKEYQIDSVDFYDLTAVVQKTWILEFCRLLIERKVNISWQMPAGTRSEALDFTVLKAMKESGVRYIAYAPESGSERTLKLVNKKVHLKTMLSSMSCAVQLGMNVKLNMVIGFPKDTTYDVFLTVLFIVRVAWIGVQDVAVNVFSAYPGSELFDRLVQEGKIGKLNDDYFYGICQDVGNSVSYCESLSGWQLTTWKLFSMAVFYSLNFLFRPQRLIRFFWNLARGKDASRLEASLIQLTRRMFAKPRTVTENS